MVISRGDRVLIKVFRHEKGYGSKKLLAEFPNKAWWLTSLKCLLRKIDASSSSSRMRVIYHNCINHSQYDNNKVSQILNI